MQLVAGRTAFEYNRRKKRKGSFWEKRYHATAVQKDDHFIRCSLYIDLNMVRAKIVDHPKKWKHSGYNEIVSPKQRYRLIDHKELSRLAAMEEDSTFSKHYQGWIENALKKGNLSRDEIWTKDVAVGSDSFIEKVRKRLGFVGTKNIPRSKSSQMHSVQEETSLYGLKNENIELEWEIFTDM